MNKIFFIVLLIFITMNVNASLITKHLNSKGLISISKKFNTSKILMVSIAKRESGLNPYAIGAEVKDGRLSRSVEKFIKLINCRYEKKKIKKRKSIHFSLYPNNLEKIKKVFIIFDSLKVTNYAVGITQISRANIKEFKVNRMDIIKNNKLAWKLSAKVLRTCGIVNKFDIYNTVECYNKGTKKSLYNRSYANNIIETYKKIKKGQIR